MPGFNPYNTFGYLQNLQDMKDRIDKTIQAYQQNQFMQPQQQAPITQNFQIVPQQNQTELQSAYANSINDVKNTFVIKKGLFVDKDFKNLWVKDVSGDIKTYRLEEVVELDEKDKALQEKDFKINALEKQIDELKGMIMYANKQSNTEGDDGASKSKSAKVQRNKPDDAE